MKNAIKRAIEGGYKSNIDWDFLAKPEKEWSMLQYDMVYGRDCRNIMLLDPLFWQALGKAEGWTTQEYHDRNGIESWYAEWHRFIDHIAEEKPIDDFFNSLLK